MNSYIKEEFKRAFFSKITLFTSIFSIVLVFGGMFEYISWIKYGDISVLYLFLSGYNSGTANFLIVVFPIISCLPFAASYVSDCKTGLNKYIYIRMSKTSYRLIRLLVNGLVGGFVLFIGPFISLLFLLGIKVFTHIPMAKEQMETFEYFKSLGIHSPIIAILIILIVLFFCGFTFATFALGISTFIQNIYLAVLLPFIYYIFSATVLINIHTYLNAVVLYDVNHFGVNFAQRCLYGIILCMVGIITFFIGGYKVEQKNT
ncbi:hypothetical protein I6G82_08805 [Lysinibacillus macroides]|uniref:Membrane-spanning protein n=1 Tax=Lysinibacillus macroides TaxID=33935 RepID=A0A0M9DGQ0_9BACI|nr:hypothetical protein [Lysinibacillus macroides]KOY80529.1 hypothetical protein ADM90_15035 [Lysinibacillus macroides]QPR69662.1 hypothetical protein I6G82_08805 [Lysinibacillus macroides]